MLRPWRPSTPPPQAARLRLRPQLKPASPAPEPDAYATEAPAWSLGRLQTRSGAVLRVATRARLGDRLDAIRSRLIKHRERIRVQPGLYAIGSPDSSSPVLVSANYKPSFDAVRFAMDGLSAWLLILDTKGVNVWCAAGKGSFGDAELLTRLRKSLLPSIAPLAPLIVPQLGAVGVSAWKIARQTGRRVHLGPIRAGDLPAYLAAGFRASDHMRLMNFALPARLVLIPRELVAHAFLFPLTFLPALILAWPAPGGSHASAVVPILRSAFLWWLAPAGGLLSGLLVTPLLLPLLPSLVYSLRGALTGLLWGLAWSRLVALPPIPVALGILSATLFSSWLAVLFTGSSPYTSLGAIQGELKVALPLYLAGAALCLLGLAVAVLPRMLGALP